MLLGGCPDRKPTPEKAPGPAESAVQADAPAQAATSVTESVSLLETAGSCEFWHEGLALDLGDPATAARRRFSPVSLEDVERVDRQGSRFAQIGASKVTYDFWLTEPQKATYIAARVHGTGSARMAAYVDGKRLGAARLKQGETRLIEIGPRDLELAPGRHRLTLSFSRRRSVPRIGGGTGITSFAEVDWVRIGDSRPLRATDAPPKRDSSITDVVLEEKPRRSVTLRERSSWRCPVWVQPNTRLRLSLGLWGPGEGTAEVLVARDEEEPVSLGEHKLGGEDPETPGWIELDESLAAYDGHLVELRLETREVTRGARVAFGEPRLERKTEPVPPAVTQKARRAVVVVLSGLSRVHKPPSGRNAGLPSLTHLSKEAVVFSGYRTPTTVPSAVMATLLTGRAPRAHALEDGVATLPDSVGTLAQSIKAESGHAAFFTGVPDSFAVYGLDRGWGTYAAISPVTDAPATRPLELAQKWLEENLTADGPQLVVVHLRGGHPPFDISRDRARELPPAEYGGFLDARRSAIQLAEVRGRHPVRLRKMPDEDWTRLAVLQKEALGKQDRELGSFFRWLKQEGAWDDTLVVVLGDVGAGERPDIPFAPAAPLSEARLHVPLLVKLPHGELGGQETNAPVTTVDVSYTLLAALGVDPELSQPSDDLRSVAAGRVPVVGRPLEATLGFEYSTRAESWLLSGTFGKVPKLCHLASDPACVNDTFDEHPITARALWQWTYDIENGDRKDAPKRAAAEMDRDAQAALTVWGAAQ